MFSILRSFSTGMLPPFNFTCYVLKGAEKEQGYNEKLLKKYLHAAIRSSTVETEIKAVLARKKALRVAGRLRLHIVATR